MTFEEIIEEAKAEIREQALAEGHATGRAEGRAEGEARGKVAGILETAKKMLAEGLSIDLVSSISGLPISQLKTLL